MGLVNSFLRVIAAGAIAVALLCVPEWGLASTNGHGLVVGRLTDNQCPNNLGIYAPKKKGDDSVDSDDCILAFTDLGETGAVMLLNGVAVPFRVIQKSTRYSKVRYDLADSAGNAKVFLDVTMDCPEGVEGCDYSGSLTMESSGASSRIHIVYYRGG
ncbi:hypothetical protein [Dyella tabacisoli]|uniref:Uncharacterized protein n=1 Tax=Dyella tabacisoli TaxID=2282381 RepID=A0A369UP81_9GAMM|nr:hypothetical protein [Dyella tabacisoli]RDD81528.1 hypothetical protein DVJ77_10125 [Dyella tabacisoli]